MKLLLRARNVEGWAVTFGTARRGGWLGRSPPRPSSDLRKTQCKLSIDLLKCRRHASGGNVRLSYLLISSLHLLQQMGTGGAASHPGPLLGSLTICEKHIERKLSIDFIKIIRSIALRFQSAH